MKKREFYKLLNKILVKHGKDSKRIDVSLIPSLTDEERSNMVYFIVRKRWAIVKELIPEGFDYSWLHCMSYMDETTNKAGYTLIHNSENAPR